MLETIEARVVIRAPYPLLGEMEEVQAVVLSELLSRDWENPASDLPPLALDKLEETDERKEALAGFVLRLRYAHPPSQPTEPAHWLHHVESCDQEAVFADYSATQLVFSARQLLLCANIAGPGVLSALSFETRVGNTKRDYYPLMLSDALSLAIRRIGRTDWPPLRTDLALREVWLWARSIPGFSDGVGETPVGRGIAAFSHLFADSLSARPGQNVFWALLGLESILGRGKDGLAQQLRAKSAVLLGAPATNKKMVTRMYETRSRFVHGDLDLPFQDAPLDELTGFTEQMNESEATGITLLLATLQVLAKEGRTNIDFEYKLV